MLEEFERPGWIRQIEEVLETVNEGVLIADDCHRIIFVNSGFVRLTGIRAEDLVGYDAQLFYTVEEWAFLEKKIEESIRWGTVATNLRFPRRTAPGCP